MCFVKVYHRNRKHVVIDYDASGKRSTGLKQSKIYFEAKKCVQKCYIISFFMCVTEWRTIMLQMKKRWETKEMWFYRWMEDMHNDEALDRNVYLEGFIWVAQDQNRTTSFNQRYFFMNRTDPNPHFCIN